MQVTDFNISFYLFIFQMYLILFLKVHECINSNINQILIKIIV